MKAKRFVSAVTVAAAAVALSLVLLAAFLFGQAPSETVEAGQAKNAVLAPQAGLVTFPRGDSPWYAQEEISVNPGSPVANQPMEMCATVINTDPDNEHIVNLEFGVANFGIGVPFQPVGATTVAVPPGGMATGCVVWIPPTPAHWCIQATIYQEMSEPIISQRNVDIWEQLTPGVEATLEFQVGPFPEATTVNLALKNIHDGWQAYVSPMTITVRPGMVATASLHVLPPVGFPLGTRDVIVDVEGYVEDGEELRLIGGFRKLDWPPVLLHRPQDPFFAESEIHVEPYPPRAGEPTEVCVELHNPTPVPQDVAVQFSWAPFGIGLPFSPIDGPRTETIPPSGVVNSCIHWVPPIGGNFCLQIELLMDGYRPQFSQRNLDVTEPLEPGVPHTSTFPVGNFPGTYTNPEPAVMDIRLEPDLLLPGWEVVIEPTFLPSMQPGEVRVVSMTVTPPGGELPPDDTPVVDVRARAGTAPDSRVIGGIRKIYRPPVPLHRSPDPPYAEREITVQPYPPRAGEPTEVCVRLTNPTSSDQEVAVQFSWAAFGIGLPFTPIDGVQPVIVPAFGTVNTCIMWVPPIGGHLCLQVELLTRGYEPQYSQRNIDIGEPLEPLTPHARTFAVGNPLDHPVTITLGLIPHFPDWGLELSQDVLPGMTPGEVREVVLTVTPPADLPADGDVVVDVEAYAEGRLIGGFRKVFRPPIPVHRPRDPIYAESEIGVDPYPALPGQPTMLSVEVFNPTDTDRYVTATFSIADFGIGLPFSTANIAPNPIRIFVPKFGAARGHVIWTPPDWGGKFCVRVTLEMEGYEPVWSQRNIDVGEPLEPDVPHPMTFLVGNPTQRPVTVTLGLIPHLEGWEFELSQDVLPNLQPGQTLPVTLTTTPPHDAELGTGAVIVDVEGFIDGELIGGIRKLDRPPIPLHKPHEKGYAESEIIIEPYPPRKGIATSVSTVVQNTSDTTMTVDLEFGWAQFGIGIPFTTTGMVPSTRSVTLGPEMTKTATVAWTPSLSGHQCVQIRLNAEGYEPQESQRNVDVDERPPCGETRVYTFTIHNDTALPVTVDVGAITFNVPADWQITITPSPTLELDAFATGVVTVTVQIPCPMTLQMVRSQASIQAVQQAAGSVPTIDVEAYVEGQLKGGIEIQFTEGGAERVIYLPLILRNR